MNRATKTMVTGLRDRLLALRTAAEESKNPQTRQKTIEEAKYDS
jgi:hypothetical protein